MEDNTLEQVDGKDVYSMAVSAEIIEKMGQLNASNMRSAVHFIDFLLNQQQKQRRTHIDFGCWEGQLEYISEDFDEELDVFEDYR